MFKDGEQKFLDALPKAIANTETKFKDLKEPVQEENITNIEGPTSSFQRVLTLPGISVAKLDEEEQKPTTDNNYGGYFGNDNYQNNQSASSFVLIISAVLALIILVAVVTMAILKYLQI